MSDIEGLAWSSQVMGDVGPHVRDAIPSILAATHARYAASQAALGLESSEPYGLMWLGVPKALVEALDGVAGVEVQRRPRARYRLPVVGGVPLIPWRYAKDRTTDVEGVPFGQPVSGTRASWFQQVSEMELPLGKQGLGNERLADLTEKDRMKMDAFSEDIRDLARCQQVAILAYASTPDALLRCFLGYATLRQDAQYLNWAFLEELALNSPRPPRLRLVDPTDTLPSFDTGTPADPLLRPRSPIEGEPTGELPPDVPEETPRDG